MSSTSHERYVVMGTYPRPPRPWTATVAPGIKPMFLIEFCVVFEHDQPLVAEKLQLRKRTKTVTPAQSRGAANAGSISSGIFVTAVASRVAYSAYPPSVMIPLIFPLTQVVKSPVLHRLNLDGDQHNPVSIQFCGRIRIIFHRNIPAVMATTTHPSTSNPVTDLEGLDSFPDLDNVTDDL